ncbi:protein kinase [Streptomyces sp. NPDC048751]|uniref:serine/threonine-protein kinase n=1 Tax=Streptomyces sp. NPDC048751 TaxID=3365591 RepID=UPI00370FEFED
MGRVWRAVDEILDRLVAVKEMRIDGLDAEDTRTRRERALREARATARIDHPNVVRVYDVVDEGERLWIVMELVHGRSLERIMAQDGPLGPPDTARIGLELVAALRQVHAGGVLHRDIKPGNVLVESEGRRRVVLTDFGIAAIEDTTALTMVGMLVGSPDYMAPERVSGRPQGPPSDLWSLGATLCAALTGHSPFSRDTTLATLHAVLYEQPELPASAGPLRSVLSTLLEKDPASRPALGDLEETLRGVAFPTPTPTVVVEGTEVPGGAVGGAVGGAGPEASAPGLGVGGAVPGGAAGEREESAGQQVAPVEEPEPPRGALPGAPAAEGPATAATDASDPASGPEPPQDPLPPPRPTPAEAKAPTGRAADTEPESGAADTEPESRAADRGPAAHGADREPADQTTVQDHAGHPLDREPARNAPSGKPPGHASAPEPTPTGTSVPSTALAPGPSAGVAPDSPTGVTSSPPPGVTPSPSSGIAPSVTEAAPSVSTEAASSTPTEAASEGLSGVPVGDSVAVVPEAGSGTPGGGTPRGVPGVGVEPWAGGSPGLPDPRSVGPADVPTAPASPRRSPGVSLSRAQAVTEERPAPGPRPTLEIRRAPDRRPDVGGHVGELPGPALPATPARKARRTALLAAAGVLTAGAVVAVVLASAPGKPDGTRAGPTAQSTVTAPSDVSSDSDTNSAPDPTPTSTSTVEGTSRPPSLPPGAHMEAGGFAWATPKGWRRDVKTGAEVHYTSPDGTQELVAKSSLARGDLMETWETSEESAHQGKAYHKVRLEETTFRGHPAVLWEYTFTLRGTPWHARLLGFDAGGKSYQINTWYQPAVEPEALKTYDRVKEGFTLL